MTIKRVRVSRRVPACPGHTGTRPRRVSQRYVYPYGVTYWDTLARRLETMDVEGHIVSRGGGHG